MKALKAFTVSATLAAVLFSSSGFADAPEVSQVSSHSNIVKESGGSLK